MSVDISIAQTSSKEEGGSLTGIEDILGIAMPFGSTESCENCRYSGEGRFCGCPFKWSSEPSLAREVDEAAIMSSQQRTRTDALLWSFDSGGIRDDAFERRRGDDFRRKQSYDQLSRVC
jgi:hypothetical protein